ncbi:28403_t:CDS:2 [Dentiscutata erythropus]|uniref:28403_t:CDS:1 n=1 Tax=Dentiscutata erythropus TaxID=1348616 RepID=A0A9N9DR59_9GLOM|nr:28403_t:CDS:2 [Dentiscutata erythropus]
MRRSNTLRKWFEKTLKDNDIIKFEYSVYENIEIIEKDVTINELSQIYKNVNTDDDDLTKLLLKEASVQKLRRPSQPSSKTSENSITRTSNETSVRGVLEIL